MIDFCGIMALILRNESTEIDLLFVIYGRDHTACSDKCDVEDKLIGISLSFKGVISKRKKGIVIDKPGNQVLYIASLVNQIN